MNKTIEKLIKQFAKLPRVGGRAAQRIVLGLLQDKTGRAAILGAALIDAAENIKPCENCACLTSDINQKSAYESASQERAQQTKFAGTNGERSEQLRNQKLLCEFCRDASRANGQLCIVRGLEDVWTLEKSGVFRGRYHIIGGLLSGAAGTTPEDLNITNLPDRIVDEKITEIIFALPNTIEGKTTQHYIQSRVMENGQMDRWTDGQAQEQMSICPFAHLSFTELASGVPLGGDLDYIDDGTLNIAFGGRKKI